MLEVDLRKGEFRLKYEMQIRRKMVGEFIALIDNSLFILSGLYNGFLLTLSSPFSPRKNRFKANMGPFLILL